MTKPYNGREVLAWVADTNGWAYRIVFTTDDYDLVDYQRDGETITIAWTRQNSAPFVGRRRAGAAQTTELGGMCALIDARKIMEGKAA